MISYDTRTHFGTQHVYDSISMYIYIYTYNYICIVCVCDIQYIICPTVCAILCACVCMHVRVCLKPIFICTYRRIKHDERML